MNKNYLLTFCMVLMSYTINAQSCSNTVNVSPNGTTIVNGVQLTTVSSGSVSNSNFVLKTCEGSSIGPSFLGVGRTGTWSTTFTFDKPINNLVMVLFAAEVGENFEFNSNGGNVSIISNSSCSTLTINGNTILGGEKLGDGKFTISSPNNFTTLTISGSGGMGGSLLGICSNSISSLGIDEETESSIVSISPNPVKNKFTIASKDNLKGYKILDETGRLITSSFNLKVKQQEIDISHFKPGIYVLSVETENKVINKKMIKID